MGIYQPSHPDSSTSGPKMRGTRDRLCSPDTQETPFGQVSIFAVFFALGDSYLAIPKPPVLWCYNVSDCEKQRNNEYRVAFLDAVDQELCVYESSPATCYPSGLFFAFDSSVPLLAASAPDASLMAVVSSRMWVLLLSMRW